jgi:uncharacterized membrane protein (UPF0127 family)
MTKTIKTKAELKQQEKLIKNGLVLILAVIVVSLGVSLVQLIRHRPAVHYGEVTINNTKFTVEIAANEATREIGLMFRKSLPEKHGMLFLFDKPGIYPFWMRNTLISLDIIYIDKDRRILNICTMPPQTDESCKPSGEALYVLELEADSAKHYHLEAGQTAEIALPKQ